MSKQKPTKNDPTTPVKRIEWPSHPNDLVQPPRLFRIHRVDGFSWQAYVTVNNPAEGIFQEYPIGKPDLFHLVRAKVGGVMMAEGQAQFLAEKTRQDKEQQAKARAEALKDQQRLADRAQ